MRDEAAQTLSNQVAQLSSNLVPIIPPDRCKVTTPSLGGFNPFEEGEQERMGAVWKLHPSPPSPVDGAKTGGIFLELCMENLGRQIYPPQPLSPPRDPAGSG